MTKSQKMIRKLVDAGYPVKYIAYKLDVNLSTVYAWMRSDDGSHAPHPRNLRSLEDLVRKAARS